MPGPDPYVAAVMRSIQAPETETPVAAPVDQEPPSPLDYEASRPMDPVAPLLIDIAGAGIDLQFDRASGWFRLVPADDSLQHRLEAHHETLAAACRDAGAPLGLISSRAAESTRRLLGNLEVIYFDDAGAALDAIKDLPEQDVIGFDFETAARNGFVTSECFSIALTRRGELAKHQPGWKDRGLGLDPHRSDIRLVAVYGGGDSVGVIDLRRTGPEPLRALALRRLVAHNAEFEAKFMLAAGIEPADLSCSMLAAGLVARGKSSRKIDGTRRPALADAALELLDVQVPKGGQLVDWRAPNLPTEAIEYAALDAVLARRLLEAAVDRMDDREVACFRTTCAAVVPVAETVLHGMEFDRAIHAAAVAQRERDLAALIPWVKAETGIDNLNSSPQREAWLKSILGRTERGRWPRAKSGKSLSTRATHLKRLAADVPAAALLIEWSKLATLDRNFGRTLLDLINPVTGRLHGELKIAGAKSGRFSSAHPNCQNLPRVDPDDPAPIRAAFMAPPGRVLVGADYSQLEFRVLAEIAAGERPAESNMSPAMRLALAKGNDLHCLTAGAIFDVDPESLDPDNDEDHKLKRQQAKSVGFAIIYGAKAQGVREFVKDATGLTCSLQWADDAIKAFLDTYPEVRAWQQKQGRLAELTREVRTPGGRRYRFDWEAYGRVSIPLAYNLPVQGGAAEVAQLALVDVRNRLRGLPGRPILVNQVHDEFLVEVDEAHTEAARGALVEGMVAAFAQLFPDAPTGGLVEAKVGSSWAATK
jgi:DNA polymerase-1